MLLVLPTLMVVQEISYIATTIAGEQCCTWNRHNRKLCNAGAVAGTGLSGSLSAEGGTFTVTLKCHKMQTLQL